MILDVYVESGVGGHIDDATQAWAFDLQYWGFCGQGDDEPAAIADLVRRTGVASVRVVERVVGDELAFTRDREPAAAAEFARTQQLTLTFISDVTEVRALPSRRVAHGDLRYYDPVGLPLRSVRLHHWLIRTVFADKAAQTGLSCSDPNRAYVPLPVTPEGSDGGRSRPPIPSDMAFTVT